MQDFQTLELDIFQYSGANLTGIRLVNAEALRIVEELISTQGLNFEIDNSSKLHTKQALLYDAVQVFTEGFKRLKYATKVELKKIICSDFESWEYGISLNNFIKSVSIFLTTFLATQLCRF